MCCMTYLPVEILCDSKLVSFYCKSNSLIGNWLNNWRLLLNITLYIYFYVHLAKVLTKEVCARKHYWFKFLCCIVVCTLIWPASEMWRALFLQQELCEDSQEKSVQLTTHSCFCFYNIKCKFLCCICLCCSWEFWGHWEVKGCLSAWIVLAFWSYTDFLIPPLPFSYSAYCLLLSQW